MKKTFWIYSLVGIGLSASLATSFQARLRVHPYVTWVAAFSIVTWAFYAWDKRISELKNLLKGWRVPELTLHLLSLLGGFPGAWIARAMFQHKSNTKRHPEILTILIVSVVLHALLAIRLLVGPPLTLWPPSEWITF
ncbi:MAG: DUF1294 domain-containing protein [Anaerolineae bacterium]